MEVGHPCTYYHEMPPQFCLPACIKLDVSAKYGQGNHFNALDRPTFIICRVTCYRTLLTANAYVQKLLKKMGSLCLADVARAKPGAALQIPLQSIDNGNFGNIITLLVYWKYK